MNCSLAGIVTWTLSGSARRVVWGALLSVALAFTSSTAFAVDPVGPTISSISPARQLFTPGSDFDLTVTATGTGTLAYQWVHNGRVIAGASGAALHVASAGTDASGWYQVLITDQEGTRRSPLMFVRVVPAATSIYAWGRSSQSAATQDAPAEAANAVAIAANRNQTMALRRDGSVVAWLYRASYYTPVVALIPTGLTDAVEIAAGDETCLAVRSDGTVVQWPRGSTGTPAAVDGMTEIVAVAAGKEHQLALRADGTVLAWGTNTYGQTTVPADLHDVVAIACGDTHSLALRSDGSVVGWGNNDYNQRTPPAGLPPVKAIAARAYYSVALCADGHAEGWGMSPQTNNSADNVPNGRHDIAAVAAGCRFIVLLRSGNPDAPILHTAGFGWYMTVPDQVGNVVQIDAGEYGAFALMDSTARTAPRIVTPPASVQVASGESVKLTIERTGEFPFTYQWRKNGVAISGATSASLPLDEVTAADSGSYDVVVTNGLGSATSNPATVTVRPAASISIESPRRIVTRIGDALEIRASATGAGTLNWQWLHNGQLVPGATGPTLQIAHVGIGDAGVYTAVVRDDNGTTVSSPVFAVVAPRVARLRSWRSDQTAEDVPTTVVDLVFGFGITADGALTPLRSGDYAAWPADARDVISIAYGTTGYMILLKSDGTLVGWTAAGGYGQYTIPAGLKDVVAIASPPNSSYVLALKANGHVVSFTSNGVPNLVPDVTDAVSIAATSQYPVIVQRNGHVVGTYGRIRPHLDDAVSVTAGETFAAVTRANGQVVRWAVTTMPDLPAFDPPVRRVCAYGDRMVVLKTDGTISGWEQNIYTSAPTDLTDVVALSLYSRAFALVDASAPLITDQPRAAVQGQANARFVIGATGERPMTYAWQVQLPGGDTWTTLADGDQYRGTQTAELTVARLPFSMNGARYRCVVTNAVGSITSDPATLTVVRSVGLTGDFDGDGRMEVLWQQVGTREIGYWPAAGGYARVGQDGAGYEIAGYGDFDGDGRSEAAWRQSTTGALVSWTSTGSVLALGIQNGGWQVLGVGDFDGDSRTEFLWRDASTKEIATRTSSGAILHLGVENTGWQVIGVGDFDADGRSEPLWQEVNTKEVGTWTMTGAYLRLGSEAGDWDELGVGDFDADGRTEPYWRNRITRQVGTWTMSGTFIALGTETDSWSVIGAGDYDGDTATDLLWRNAVTKEVGAWTAAGSYLRFGSQAGDWRAVPQAPVITSQPPSQWLRSGAGATLSVSVAASPVAIVQWQVSANGAAWADVADGGNTSGAGTTSLTIADLTRALNGNRYRCIVRNGAGHATSTVATLNVSAPRCVPNDFDGDGKTDVLWSYTPLQDLGIWTANGYVRLGTEGTGWSVIGTGDFDGDGRVELLWRHTASGQIATWPSGGGYLPLGTEGTWQVIRCGDFDGDGKTDLLWRHSGTGQVVTWTRAGTYLDLGAETDGWQVIGIADFDGDGRDEPVWRNSGTRVYQTVTMAGVTRRLGSEDNGWTPVGFGDVDGDGQAEPFWRKAATLENVCWPAAGGMVRLGTEAGGWHVIAVGDYDGDGRSEPLWRHATTGELATWTMAGAYVPLGAESDNWRARHPSS
jgi:alpha-tubulin suppressor-like RCC1 family protein